VDINKNGLVYSVGSVTLCPYPSEKILAQSYFQFEQDDTLDVIFHERVPPLSEFLQEFSNPSRTVLTFGEADGDVINLCGLGWINQVKNMFGKLRWAETGAGVFKKYWGRNRTKVFVSMAVEYAFCELKLDAIHGVTPAPNRSMLRLLKELGFDLAGPIPLMTLWRGDVPCSAYISTMEAERWRDLGRSKSSGKISGNEHRVNDGAVGATRDADDYCGSTGYSPVSIDPTASC
jgi:RimJ/RimL family protein N-acetyltransferase